MRPNCAQCRQLSSALYDDELTVEVRAAILDHLSNCDACRQSYRTFQSSLAAVAGLGDEHAGDSFDRAVLRKVEQAMRVERRLAPLGIGGSRVAVRMRMVMAAAILATVSLLLGLHLGAPAELTDAPGVAQLIRDAADGRNATSPPPAEETVAAQPDEPDLEAMVVAALEQMGFRRQGERWVGPLEAELEASPELVFYEGSLMTRAELQERIRADLLAEAEAAGAGTDEGGETPVAQEHDQDTAESDLAVAGDPEQEFDERVRDYLLDMGFVEIHGEWYSETEARLLEPGIACIRGRIVTEDQLKEELGPVIFAEHGFVQDSLGRWVQKQPQPSLVTPDPGSEELSPGDRFWAPEIAGVEPALGDRTRLERTVRDLRSGNRRDAAIASLQAEGPESIGALQVAYEAAKQEDDRLSIGRVLAWYGIETREVEDYVDRLVEAYAAARDGTQRQDRYVIVLTELESLGLMSGRFVERSFRAQPTLRLAELLSAFRHEGAELYLLDAYLGRPGADPAAVADLHPDLVDWWLDRPASGEPEVFDRALPLLNRSDERDRMLGVHLLEAIAYRHPEWAGRIFAELLHAAEGSFCSCAIATTDDKAYTTQISGCRLHEQVPVGQVHVLTRWERAQDLIARDKIRSTRGSVVAAEIGRVLSNLSGEKHDLNLRGERSGDAVLLREHHKSTLSNWRLQYRQHHEEYEARWQRIAPLAQIWRESEAQAPWHIRNELARHRTDAAARLNFADPNHGLVGVAAVQSDRASLASVLGRMLARTRGDRLDTTGFVVGLDLAEGLPRSLLSGVEVYALSMNAMDAVNITVWSRGLVATCSGEGLRIAPPPRR